MKCENVRAGHNERKIKQKKNVQAGAYSTTQLHLPLKTRKTTNWKPQLAKVETPPKTARASQAGTTLIAITACHAHTFAYNTSDQATAT